MEGRRWADNGMENNMSIANLANCDGKIEKSASLKGSPLIPFAFWLIGKLINSQRKSFKLEALAFELFTIPSSIILLTPK